MARAFFLERSFYRAGFVSEAGGGSAEGNTSNTGPLASAQGYGVVTHLVTVNKVDGVNLVDSLRNPPTTNDSWSISNFYVNFVYIASVRIIKTVTATYCFY